MTTITSRINSITTRGFARLIVASIMIFSLWCISVRISEYRNAIIKVEIIQASGALVTWTSGRAWKVEAQNITLSDSQVIALQGLPHLTDLVISQDAVTESQLDFICKNTSLLQLDIIKSSHLNKVASNRFLRCIANCNSLVSLDLNGLAVEKSSFDTFAPPANLVKLVLADMYLGKSLEFIAPQLIHLRLLSLRGTDFNDSVALHLNQLTNLQKLRLSRTKVTSNGVKLIKIRSLEQLDLSECNIDGPIADCLSGFPVLSHLCLDNIPANERIIQGIQGIEAASCLQALSLRNTSISDEDLSQLLGLGRLNSVDLTGTTVTRREIERFEMEYYVQHKRIPKVYK